MILDALSQYLKLVECVDLEFCIPKEYPTKATEFFKHLNEFSIVDEKIKAKNELYLLASNLRTEIFKNRVKMLYENLINTGSISMLTFFEITKARSYKEFIRTFNKLMHSFKGDNNNSLENSEFKKAFNKLEEPLRNLERPYFSKEVTNHHELYALNYSSNKVTLTLDEQKELVRSLIKREIPVTYATFTDSYERYGAKLMEMEKDTINTANPKIRF